MFEYKTVNQTKTVSEIIKTPLIDVEHFLHSMPKNISNQEAPIPKTILHKINCNKFYDGKRYNIFKTHEYKHQEN